MSLLRERMYRNKALKATFNLRCDAASAPVNTMPPYPMRGIISDTINLLLFSNGVCDACGFKERKIQYTF
jgi:hypothetical protein